MEESQLKELRLNVEIRMRPRLYAAVLPMVGELNEFGNVVSRAKKLLDDAGITPTDSPFGYYLSDSEEVRPEEFIWAAGYPIPPGTKVERPLEILQVSEQQIARATIEGIRLTDKVWARFAQAIKDRGYIPAFPPAVEFWRGGGEGEKISWKTEMQIQVFHPDRGYPGMEIAFKETKPFTAVVLPLHGYFADLSEAAVKLEKYLKDKKVRTAGPPFGRYLTDPSKVPFSQNEWEVGYPVEEGTEAEPPFEIRRFDGEKVAFTILPGPPEPDYPWAPFILQLALSGYLPIGPAIEIFHSAEKSGIEGTRVELQISVAGPQDIAESAVEFGRKIAEAVGNRGFDFQVRKAEPFQAVMLTATGPFEELAVAMKKLQGWMELSGTRPTGPSFIQQNSNLRVENPEYPTSWDVGYPVPDGTRAPAPFKNRTYPATLETSVRLSGTFDGDELNQQWSSWLLDGNYMAAGGALVFCPDRLYARGDGRHRWEVRTAIKKIEKKLPDLEISTQWAKPTIAVVLPMRGRHSQEPEALARLEAYMK
jgi:DNA gyrase inhibitor GyrI